MPSYQLILDSVQRVGQYLMPKLKDLTREHVVVVLLTHDYRHLDTITIYQGTAGAVNIRIAEILMPVIRADAGRFVMAHNHPGGNPQPSEADLKTTKLVIQGCELLGLSLMDHIIVGWRTWYSMLEHGVGGFE